MIHNFNQDHPAIADYDKGILGVLMADHRFDVQVSSEYLNLADFEQDPDYIEKTARYLTMKYGLWKPDAIVTDKAVFSLFNKYLTPLFRDTPVFIPGDRDGPGAMPIPPNMTLVTWGISERDLERDVELILSLRPKTGRIYVVIGASAEERRILRHAQKVREKFAGRVPILLTDTLSQADMLDELRHAPEDSAVLFLRFALDADGQSFIPARVFATICRRTPAPVFIMDNHLLGNGAVGGYVLDHGSLGRQMGRLVLDRLGGHDSTGGTLVEGPPGGYVFDARALDRFRIAPSKLPRGSIVRFREDSLWAMYRGYILAGVALLLFEAVLILGLVVNRGRRKRAEAALVALNISLEARVLERTQALNDSNEALSQAKEELETLNAQLETASRTDSLTGLANRRHADEVLGDRHREFVRSGAIYSLALLDIDHFKRVNDAHGHEAGDCLLRQLAAELTAGVRANDIVSRWGGEEFLLLLPQTDAGAAAGLMERVRRGVAQWRCVYRDVTLAVTITAGVASPREGDTLADVLRRADAALYRGKADGRNRIVTDEADAAWKGSGPELERG